jgi:opacity protein-like surface antigen
LAGEDVGKEPAGKTVLLKIPEIEQPSLLDAAKISLYGHYDLDDEVFGAGFRLSYDIHENAMLRAEYIAPEFDFEGSGVGASSSLTVQVSLPMENVPFAPYVITGAGITSFDEPDLSALIGAGVDWIVNERISVFLEYEYSTGDGDSINAVRLGASYSF